MGHHNRHKLIHHHRGRLLHAAPEPSLANFIEAMENNCVISRDENGKKTQETKQANESEKWCSAGVADGLERAGFHFTRPGHAYELPAVLASKKMGFQSIDVNEIKHPKAGDVMFIKPFTGIDNKQHYHTAMWTGKAWISDFNQGNNWQVYKGALKHVVPLDADHVILMRNPSLAAQADQMFGHKIAPSGHHSKHHGHHRVHHWKHHGSHHAGV